MLSKVFVLRVLLPCSNSRNTNMSEEANSITVPFLHRLTCFDQVDEPQRRQEPAGVVATRDRQSRQSG